MNEESGSISDGYHTFDELYRHRRELFFALCRNVQGAHIVWRSKLHHEGDNDIYEGMFIAGIDAEPGKQISYHFGLKHWDDMAFAETYERAPKWDGHTPDDVLERLKKL
ncbi:MAG TPA: hypothetical protein VHC68_00130 [Candidatus Paceibacterota bacterium]|nr:hypothetical protein [Candidatus Paceibacterota bacterium]